MSAADTLLPGNATALEEELARTWATLDGLDPAVIETVWDAWRCPAVLLPWLAWAMSVDHWESGWDEVTRRQAIADSPNYHRTKGTRLAVELALALLQTDTAVTEWWETAPRGRRGTAAVFVQARPDRELGALRLSAAALVSNAKPKSRAVAIRVGTGAVGPIAIAGGSAVSRVVVIQPHVTGLPPIVSPFPVRAGHLVATTLTIQPRPS